ncbi:geranylgeranyl diphosphate reductase [Sandaracinobacteroides saxicola]|uniref:Geranylgeranyl diphosphate reductase n=1 Tax=Sandaracinobacteroides saxicola TaxID=2759707 RepID=A0A7G5IKU5_9SPHN|nr:geranylgeranyl diphosphate reductase [Sandaracinobacteroides saxicola]QMW23987.1 geranylgeranyl diphosphate reductase [Sandaracinobacteroides saxicola]
MAERFDVVVVGGGPAGATAATDLARAGVHVLLLDRAGRVKPCGGAIPPKAIEDFDIPPHMLVARATSARMVAPSSRTVDMPVGDGFVGMVDREHYDEWLRARAALAGAERRTGGFERIVREDVRTFVEYRVGRGGPQARVETKLVIGADGARSAVACAEIAGADRMPCVFAYHEIIETPANDFDGSRCDVWYQGHVSPDFYGWVFPHGETTSVGVGSANKGFALRNAVGALRAASGLTDAETVRGEGAPIPLKPLDRWDNGRDVVVVGDAAGVVAPASGEGIFYAMTSGRMAADVAVRFLATGDARLLRQVRKQFMAAHGRVFWVLRMMQYFWYSSDKRRERFVHMCADKDVQALTWQAYMHKKLVKARPAAHARIFFKDMGHLIASAVR